MTVRRQSSRDSGFSLFRISLAAAVIGGLFLVGAFVLTQIDNANQRQPLMIDPPLGAELRLQEDSAGTSRLLYYFVPNANAEAITNYYDQKMREFYANEGTDSDICRRVPAQGNYENYTEGSGIIPYEFRCLFQSLSGNPLSNSGAARETYVTIQPGIRNDETGVNNEGGVVVEYTQIWQP